MPSSLGIPITAYRSSDLSQAMTIANILVLKSVPVFSFMVTGGDIVSLYKRKEEAFPIIPGRQESLRCPKSWDSNLLLTSLARNLKPAGRKSRYSFFECVERDQGRKINIHPIESSDTCVLLIIMVLLLFFFSSRFHSAATSRAYASHLNGVHRATSTREPNHMDDTGHE